MHHGLPMGLNKCHPGDIIAFSSRGILWTVIHRTDGKKFNSVLQMRSENNSVRTYDSTQRRWTQEIIRLQQGA